MTTKEYLSRAVTAREEIARLNELKALERAKYEKITPAYSQEQSGSGGGDEHKYERYCISTEKLDRQIRRQKKIIDEVYAQILRCKRREHRQVLKYRYIKGMTWEATARKMNYSVRHTERIFNSAIREISAIREREKTGQNQSGKCHENVIEMSKCDAVE